MRSVPSRDTRPPVVGTRPAQASQQQALTATLHARQADGLAAADLQVDPVEADTSLLRAHALQPEEDVAGSARYPFSWGHLPLEHHGDQLVHLERGESLAHEPPLAEHGHPGAEFLHFLQLVGDEEHGLALRGQPAQGVEELRPLRGADAGGGLVEDQHACAQPQQAQQLQLLALADGERFDLGLEIEGQARAIGPARRRA